MRSPRGSVPAVVLRALVSLVVTAPVVFFAVETLPGDAGSASVRTSSSAVVAAQRRHLGLDRPVLERFADWLGGLWTGRLGATTDTGVPVAQLLSAPLQTTLVLAVAALVPAIVVGVAAGVGAGVQAGSRSDRVLSSTAASVMAAPEFVVAIGLLVVLSRWTGLLPPVSLFPAGSSPLSEPSLVVLPAATLAVVAAAPLFRYTRAVVAAENTRDHVEAARLAGLPETRVIWRHLLPGAAAPITQACASLTPYVVGGTIVTEQVFGYPGIGALLVTRIAARDTTSVATITMILALIVATAFCAADLLGRRTSGPAR
ncbi:ABC transporter permease [Gordonia sp. (in: high G+C Gram-positive bacteria)]|uniref:ABC transporter permease n=1 Tax=Gordonia sp. (in: high G+C Gram-positive bacteria) TaxID=84139 RepID=UPI003C754800